MLRTLPQNTQMFRRSTKVVVHSEQILVHNTKFNPRSTMAVPHNTEILHHSEQIAIHRTKVVVRST